MARAKAIPWFLVGLVVLFIVILVAVHYLPTARWSHWPSWIFLLVFVGLQLAVFGFAWRRAYATRYRTHCESEQDRFQKDIKARALLGQSPDWHFYREELNHYYEQHDDKLRSLASSALALGLASTIALLVMNVPAALANAGAPLEERALEAARGTIFSLTGSLLGAGFHLVIVLWMMPRAEERFDRRVSKLLQDLGTFSEALDESRAHIASAGLKADLDALRESLSTGLSTSVATALGEFPGLVKDLATKIEVLAGAVKVFEERHRGVVMQLSACAEVVTKTSQTLEPSVQAIVEANAGLREFPDRLRIVVSEAQKEWAADLGRQQKEQLDQIVASADHVAEAARQHEAEAMTQVRELRSGVSEIRVSIESLPQHLVSATQKVSLELGREFGREAAGRFQDIAQKIDEREEQWRHDLQDRFGTLLDGVAAQVEDRLVRQLEEVSKRLGTVSELLADEVSNLGAAHTRVSEEHGRVVAAWQGAGEFTANAAKNLVEAQEALRGAASVLREEWEAYGPAFSELRAWATSHESRGQRFETLARVMAQIAVRRLVKPPPELPHGSPA